MNRIITVSTRYVPLIAILIFLAGCNQSCTGTYSSSSGSSSSELTVNGRRTITKKHDGITRKVETTTEVDIQDGQVTKFPKMAVIKIQESGDSDERQAELRENAGILELWMNDSGTFRRGTPEEETWVKNFLKGFTAK